ncbi:MULTISPECIES: hypothetical protein [Myroides]|uniref:Uncharacterized protein n=1 Tax=Myroides albus TaxID=2562892 RepID=A0A6I3LJG1_9FLAO|nr:MULTISPECIES: hypothetical protein [Myroides]MTG98393.1 hypothetical protein [Myroides albus]MVX36801.1 hypothetical protein [Myroides sp. LoEW2-1]UVD79696.1 hypothetical protein NWE55_16495 [Myroides albus]
MKHFNTNLEFYFNEVLQKKSYNKIVQDVIYYISTNSFTQLGINSILESYNLSSIKSLKLSFLDIYCEIKKVILETENYIKLNQMQDLILFKKTCQIEEHELQEYKKDQLTTMYIMQTQSISMANNLEDKEKQENLQLFKSLVGIQEDYNYLMRSKLNIPNCFS